VMARGRARASAFCRQCEWPQVACFIVGSWLLMTSFACTQPGSGSDAPGVTPSPDASGVTVAASPTLPALPGVQTATVRVGPITEIVSFAGRVSDGTEVGLSLPVAARLASVSVETGQNVDEGELLAETDVAVMQADLTTARTRYEAAAARLESTRLAIQVRLSQAEANLDVLTATPSTSERLTNESAVASARAALRRAEEGLEAATKPSSPTSILAAEQAVAAAQLAVKQAEDGVATLRRGTDPSALRQAVNGVAQAQMAYDNAQDAYRTLVKGARPVDAPRRRTRCHGC